VVRTGFPFRLTANRSVSRDGGAKTGAAAGALVAVVRNRFIGDAALESTDPADHPASIRSAVSLEFSHAPAAQPLASAPRFAPAAAIAAAADIDLLFVRSNAWWLVDDGYFYDEKWHGGVLAGVAGMFSSGHDKAYIASSWYPRFLCPYGSHPLLDPNYSSAHFAVEHHGLSMTRFEKTALVAEWSPALQNLRVCQRDGSGRGNCGKCEKCIGTMTTLLALGKLGECGAFAQKEVTPELLYGFKDYDGFYNDEQAQERYRELLPALAARGRDDLVAAIRNLLAYAEKKRA
jgi:hypothetical protein